MTTATDAEHAETLRRHLAWLANRGAPSGTTKAAIERAIVLLEREHETRFDGRTLR